MDTDVRTEDFAELVGEDLSGVTFVRDYLQLQFNPPPMLNAYTPVTVRCRGRSATFGESEFANLVVGQIDKVVRDVRFVPGRSLAIAFEDGSEIEVSLRPEDCTGHEALYLHLRDHRAIVV